MKYAAFSEILTPRLKLRKLRIEDACDFFQFAGNPQVCQYMLWTPHKAIADSEDSIRTSLLRYDTEAYYRWGIALKETDQLIGIIQLLGFDENASRCSFAYMLSQQHWGKSYATEALKAAIDFAFSQMEIQTITADHFAENPASGAAMRKSGMVYLKTIPEKYEKDGKRFDAIVYQINK